MNVATYNLSTYQSAAIFTFRSIGPNGDFLKVIQFTETEQAECLTGFGDFDPTTGTVSDIVVTNNGDKDKVLATVVKAVYIFTKTYPERQVMATGSTPARTRTYQIGIARYLADVKKDFDIYGRINNEWVPFEPNVNYTAFLATRKNY